MFSPIPVPAEHDILKLKPPKSSSMFDIQKMLIVFYVTRKVIPVLIGYRRSRVQRYRRWRRLGGKCPGPEAGPRMGGNKLHAGSLAERRREQPGLQGIQMRI